MVPLALGIHSDGSALPCHYLSQCSINRWAHVDTTSNILICAIALLCLRFGGAVVEGGGCLCNWEDVELCDVDVGRTSECPNNFFCDVDCGDCNG